MPENSPPTSPAPLPQDQRPAVRLLKALNRLFARVYHRVDVVTPCRLPARGPAIVICNHTSGVDPQLIQSACPRLITWMMAAEYNDIPGIRWILRQVDVIPVTRSGRDMAATRLAMRALENGQLLGIFPEGRIEETRELLPFQTGVALLAMKTGARVFPAYLDGTQRGLEMVPAFTRPQRAILAFGEEVRFDRSARGREGLEAATLAMQNAVAALRDRLDKSR